MAPPPSGEYDNICLGYYRILGKFGCMPPEEGSSWDMCEDDYYPVTGNDPNKPFADVQNYILKLHPSQSLTTCPCVCQKR